MNILVVSGIFLFSSIVVMLLTLVPFLPTRHWISRLGEFPRLQIAALAIILLFLLPPFLSQATWLAWLYPALGICIVYQLVWILPYTRLFPAEVRKAAAPLDDRNSISVLSANVLMSNRNVAGLCRVIDDCDPDIVLLLETNAWWQERLRELRTSRPHGMNVPLDNLYGMHLYSRLPMRDVTAKCLVQEGVPSIHAEVSLPSGHRVQLHCLHPAPPSPTENTTSRQRDSELMVVARAVSGRRSVIATGDFNDVAWSPTTRLFRKMSGLLDPRIGRGMFSTFHARFPFLRIPLDHVFHSDDFALVDLRVLTHFGSDHLPIHYKLQHEPRASVEQSAPEPDRENHRAARELGGQTGATPEDVPRPGE